MKIRRLVCTVLAAFFVSFYAYNLLRMQHSAVSVGVEANLRDFLSGPHFDNPSAENNMAQATTPPPPQPQPKALTAFVMPMQGTSPPVVTKEKKRLPVESKMEPIIKDVALDTSPVVTNEKKRLQTILDGIHIKTGQPYSGDLWEVSEYIPEWMKEYFAWHKQERLTINESNWKSKRFLVMQCLDFMDDHCGGTADRLKPFVLLLREAHKSKRLLFIHWNRPARLEEFLVPPRGGLDWRAPPFLVTLLYDKEIGKRPVNYNGLIQILPTKESLLRSRFQSITGGAEFYDKEFGLGAFDEVYHDVWRVFFTPSMPVRKELEHNINEMELVPGEYAAAHLRALYGGHRVETRSLKTVEDWTHNALNCASQLRPGGPIFFASDHTYAIEVAQSYGVEKSSKIVARKHGERRPYHFEKAENWESLQPSDFYDTFVDLLLIGMGKCVNFNRGGFGSWGLLIGYSSTECSNSQKTSIKGIGVRCNWTEAGEPSQLAQRSKAPLFLDPLDDGHTGKLSEPKKDIIVSGISNATMLGNVSSTLPKWMTDYFAWHKKTRSELNESNWKSTRYLTLSCINKNSCGGVSDRLRPLPHLVLLAARHKRLIFISWDRPAPLEEFLLPPDGANRVDWRVPVWLKNRKSIRATTAKVTTDLINDLERRDDLIEIRTTIQTPDAGKSFYESQPEADSTYESVFHDLFRAFFTPAPRLAALMDTTMRDHGLVPGHYASAHLRAMLGNRKWRDPHETIKLTVNAINCASELFPGGPVYFAADIKFAVEVAQEYGRQNKLPVATLDFNADPIHFDKDNAWKTRDPSEYDDTFVDLFMLGQSRCVAYSNGGFGIFGQLISYDSNCTVQHFKQRKIRKNCSWTHADGTREDFGVPRIDIPKDMLVKPK